MATGKIPSIYDFSNGVPVYKTAVAAATTHTITIPYSATHLIMVASSSYSCNAIFLSHTASSGNAIITEISKGSNVTITSSGQTITLTNTTSQNAIISDFVLRGTTFANVTS